MGNHMRSYKTLCIWVTNVEISINGRRNCLVHSAKGDITIYFIKYVRTDI